MTGLARLRTLPTSVPPASWRSRGRNTQVCAPCSEGIVTPAGIDPWPPSGPRSIQATTLRNPQGEGPRSTGRGPLHACQPRVWTPDADPARRQLLPHAAGRHRPPQHPWQVQVQSPGRSSVTSIPKCIATLAMMFWESVRTVNGLMSSSRPISSALQPLARRARTCRSRGLNFSGRGLSGWVPPANCRSS